MEEIKNIIKNYKYQIVVPVLAAVIFSKYLYLFLGIVVFAILLKKYGEKIFIFYTIFTFLSLTSTLDKNLRVFIQVSNYLILFYLFFKNYGLEYKNYVKPNKFLSFIVLGSLFLYFFSAMFSGYKLFAFEQISRTLQFYMLMFLYFQLLYYYKDVYSYLVAFYIMGVFFTGLLVYQFIVNGFSFLALNDEYMVKLKDFYIPKNTMGTFFTMVIIMSLIYIYKTKKRIIKQIFLLTIILFSIGLIITNSRSSIMALIIALFFLFYFQNKRVIVKIVFSLLSLSVLFLIPQVQDFFSLYMRFESFSTGRDLIYVSIWAILPYIWLTGAGPGATKYFMEKYTPYQINSTEQMWLDHYYIKADFGHAHNFYLFYFCDLGILGFIFSIMLPYFFFKIGNKCITYLKGVNEEYYLISLGISTVGVTYFSRGFLEWSGILSYGQISTDLPFWILLLIQSYIYDKKVGLNKFEDKTNTATFGSE